MANRKTSHCRDRQAEFKERMDTVFRDSEQLSLLGGGAYVLSMVFQPHRRQWHLSTSTNAPDNVWPFSMNEFSQAAHDPARFATTDSLNGDGFETGTLTTSKFESGRRSIPIESILNPESEVESKFTAPTCHESGHNVNHVGVEALPRSSLRGRSIVLEPDLNPDSEVQGNTTTAINPTDSMTDKIEAQFTVAWVMPSSVKPYSRWRSGCFTCRLLRKKCDNGRPKCKACEKPGLYCDYEQPLWWKNRDIRRKHLEDAKTVIRSSKLNRKRRISPPTLKRPRSVSDAPSDPSLPAARRASVVPGHT